MSNEQNNGISIQVSNESVQAVVGGIIEWRKIGSSAFATALEVAERLVDKGLGAIMAVEAARQARLDRFDNAAMRGEATGPKEYT